MVPDPSIGAQAAEARVSATGGPLDHYGKIADIPAPSEVRRRLRLEGRDGLRRLDSTPEDVRRCGLHVVREGGVQLRVTVDAQGKSHAGWAGVGTCGKVWLCPVCSAKILTRRTEDLERGLSAWLAPGESQGTLWRHDRSVSFLTLTVRHKRGHDGAVVWDALLAAWRILGMTYAWKRFREVMAVVGIHRTVEVTHSFKNGWHPHLHVIAFLDAVPDDKSAREAWTRVVLEWEKTLRSLGFEAWDDAQDMRLAHDVGGAVNKLGKYVSKAQYTGADTDKLALEATRADIKSAGRGHRTPFQILRDIMRVYVDGESIPGYDVARDLGAWADWVRISKGRRQHWWGPGLRALLGLDQEATDEDLAAEEMGSQEDALAEVSGDAYSRHVLRRPGNGYVFLRAVEAAYDYGGPAFATGVVRLWFPDALTLHRVGYARAG